MIGFGVVNLSAPSVQQRVLPESCLLPYDMMVVDTPGMIDTPLKGEQLRYVPCWGSATWWYQYARW